MLDGKRSSTKYDGFPRTDLTRCRQPQFQQGAEVSQFTMTTTHHWHVGVQTSALSDQYANKQCRESPPHYVDIRQSFNVYYLRDVSIDSFIAAMSV